MSKVTTEWNGDQIIRHMERAAVDGLNDTVDAARDDARATHEAPGEGSLGWKNRDVTVRKNGRTFEIKAGHLEEEIVSAHAAYGEREPTASFGTTRRSGFYGYFHELGTIREIARPFLRPVADRVFPTLESRITRRFLRR